MPITVSDKTGQKTNREWQETVQCAFRSRKQHWNGDKNWTRAYDLFKGKHWQLYNAERDEISSDQPRDLITVNITGSSCRGMLPFLVNKNPKIICKPRRYQDVVSAALQQEVMNYEWHERKMQKQLKRSVLDSVICGHGILKTGFNLDINWDAASNPEKYGQLSYEDYITKEAPYIKRVVPFQFMFDPEAVEYDLASARWCAEVFFKNPYDVLNNKRYNRGILNKIRTSEVSPATIPTYLTQANSLASDGGKLDWGYESSRERWILYELWDKKFKKYMVYIDGIEEPLFEGAWPYDYLDGFPYTKLDFIPIPNECYGVGLPFWVEDQQFELNRVRTRWFQHGRRFNRKYEVQEGLLSDQQKLALQYGEDGTILEVAQTGQIRPVDDAAMSSDHQVIEQQIKQDFREITGQDELARGGSLPSRTSATEVDARTSLLTLKTDEYRAGVDEFVDDAVTQVNQHVKNNYQTKKVIQITGPRGQMWVSYTPEDIKAEVDVTIETTSAPRTDPAKEKAEALQIFSLIMQNLQIILQSGVKLDLPELFRWIFEKVGTTDSVRFFSALAAPPVTTDGSTPEGAVPAQALNPAVLNGNAGQANAAALGAAAGPSSGGVGV